MSARGATAPAKSQPNNALWSEKILSPEVQTISNIIENSISQVEIVATLPSILQFHTLSGVVDEDLSRVLQEHQILTEKLESLNEESENDQRGEAEEATRRERTRLEEDIRSSTKKVLKAFKVNPNALFSLRAELDVKVGKSESILIKALKTFHSYMKLFTQLDKDPEVPSTSFQSLTDLISQEETVATTIKEVDEKIAKCEREIKGHQDFIQEEDLCLLTDEQEIVEETSTKLTGLQHEIDELKIQLDSLMLKNGHEERIMLEKNEIQRKTIKNSIEVFDNKMEEIQTKLELTESAYENEQKMMKELEKNFPALEEKYNQILEKRRLAEEKIREEKKELELKTKAAITLQSWWRGCRTRKALKNKGKNKKGKKGKGRKTK